jgi:twitching motility protein PilT
MSDPNQPSQDLLPVLGSVDDYLRFCMEYDASDLHLATGAQPTWRRYGNLQPIWNNAAILTPEDTRRLAYGFLGEAQTKQLESARRC